MLYHDNRPRPGQSLTLKFVAKLSLEVEILAALKFLKIPPYCDCWHGGALFSLAQAHRMRNCYSALLYCTIMFLLCCANICQRYCCMKTRYGFTAVALKVYDVLACVAVFSVSFQASGSRARHGTEVTKKKKEKKTLSPFLTFCSRPMPSRDIPFRYEETEKTATQANDVYDLAWVNSTGIILSIVRHLGQRELCRQKTAFPAAFLAESLKTNGTD